MTLGKIVLKVYINFKGIWPLGNRSIFIWGFLKDDILACVELEISSRVIISWRILVSFRGLFTYFYLYMMKYMRLVGACGRRPLWSPPWVPVTFSHCFLFFLSFYCPTLPLPCLALTLPYPCPCPCPALFWIFLLLLGTRGGSYTGNGYLKQDRTYTWWEAFEHMQKLLSRK